MSTTMLTRLVTAFIFLALVPATAVRAADPWRDPPGYTDLADLVLESPLILRVMVGKTSRLSSRLAPDVPAGDERLLVEGRVLGVLKADGLLPEAAEWLWQGPRGALVMKGREFLLFARAGPGGKPGRLVQLQLVRRTAQLPWTQPLDARVRAILAEAARGVPRLVAVRSGFHVPGAVAGESESQIFLDMADGAPVTLVVLRRPGEAVAVRVATGDLIDESAAPVIRETLLWRTLACDLPARPPASLGTDAGLLADYTVVREALGACGRSAP